MFNKCVDQHKKPICFWAHIVGLIIGIYGLWIHSWSLIVVAVVICILGHLLAAGPGKKKTAVTPKEPTLPAEQPEMPSEPTPEPPKEPEMPEEPTEPIF